MADLYHYSYLNANGYLKKFQVALGMPNLDRAQLSKYLNMWAARQRMAGFIVKDDKGYKALYNKNVLNRILGVDETGFQVTKPQSNPYLNYLKKIIDEEQWKEIEREFPQEEVPEDNTPEDSDMQTVSDKLIQFDNYGEVMESILKESHYDAYYHFIKNMKYLISIIEDNQIELSGTEYGEEDSYRGGTGYLSLTRTRNVEQGYQYMIYQQASYAIPRIEFNGNALSRLPGISIAPLDYQYNWNKRAINIAHGKEQAQTFYNDRGAKRTMSTKGALNTKPVGGDFSAYMDSPQSGREMYNSQYNGEWLEHYKQNNPQRYEIAKSEIQHQPYAQSEESLTFNNGQKVIPQVYNYINKIDILLKYDPQRQQGYNSFSEANYFLTRDLLSIVKGKPWENKIFIHINKNTFNLGKPGFSVSQWMAKYPYPMQNIGQQAQQYQQVMESKKKTIIITESQLEYINSHLTEGIGYVKYSVEPNKVKIVKKYLDDNFVKGGIACMGEDGYPTTTPIVAIKGTDGQVARNMSDKQLFNLLLDKFGKIYSNSSRVKRFLQQIIKDWYYDKISKEGLLSKNLY